MPGILAPKGLVSIFPLDLLQQAGRFLLIQVKILQRRILKDALASGICRICPSPLELPHIFSKHRMSGSE